MADYGDAIGLYNALVHREGRYELRDGLARAHFNRGMARKNLQRLEDAIADLSACVGLLHELVHREGHRELAGYLGWGYAGYANLLLRMGQREKAWHRAREAVSLLQSEVARTDRADLPRQLEMAEAVLRDALQLALTSQFYGQREERYLSLE